MTQRNRHEQPQRATRAVAVALATMSTFGAGCILGGVGSDDEGEYGEQVRACSTGDVRVTLEIVDAYADSLHEMVACGGLAVSLCNGVVSGIVNAMLDGSTDATPSGWSFEADGTYRTEGDGVVMTTQFFLDEDFEFAASGALVTDNVFLVDNYLVDAAVNIDLSTGRTTLSYSETGPLVELLGYGAEPPNPIALTLADIETLDDKLGALQFEADVVVDDVRDEGTVHYHVVTPRLAASALLTGAGMRYELEKADGTRDSENQALTVDEWTIEFVDEGGGALNGSSSYTVAGGDFDFTGVARFDNSSVAENTVSCP